MGRERRVTDHLGKEYNSVTAMCDHWGISQRLYYDRLNRNFSQEEALSGIRQRKNKYDPEEVARIHGLPEDIVRQGLELNLSIREIKRLAEGKLYLDHLNRHYNSFNSMCRAWGKNATTVKHRLSQNWTLAEALEKKSRKDTDDNTEDIKEKEEA